MPVDVLLQPCAGSLVRSGCIGLRFSLQPLLSLMDSLAQRQGMLSALLGLGSL